MIFTEALITALQKSGDPVVTGYGFYRLAAALAEAKTYEGGRLTYVPSEWNATRAKAALRRLIDREVLTPDSDFRGGVWRIEGARTASAEDIACIVDPFCYVSHLSAMQRYHLTDRSPEALHLTTPADTLWAELRDARMRKDNPGNAPSFPKLIRRRIGPVLRQRPIVVHETKHPPPSLHLRGEATRVSSIGWTFVSMLSEPELCGGMHHVLDVWDREARGWLGDIIEAIDQVQVAIVKVRAGYILTERLGMSDPRIEAWAAFAQRGGSRKLDPESPYVDHWSERWMISLNV